MTMIKQSTWLIEQRARDMNYLEHLKYQLQYFEKKTWEIIESRDLMSQEVFNRTYRFYARQVKELLEEQAEVIDDLGIINMSLMIHEELVWQEVETRSIFLKAHECFFIFSFSLLPSPASHPYRNDERFHARQSLSQSFLYLLKYWHDFQSDS